MIGSVIQETRQRLGLSLGALADRAGVSKATLSRWEAGKSRPYAPELAGVLEALQIPEAIRRQCFQQLGTPQAERYLSETASQSESLPISGGELLRALRQRAGLAQADAARAVGVTQALLSRWEHNDCWPGAETLDALCRCLGATPGERDGFLKRDWKSHKELPQDKEALDNALFWLGTWTHNFAHDLYYLALGSRYRNLCKRGHINASEALAIWGNYGSYLIWHGRMEDGWRISAPVLADLKGSSHKLTGGQAFALSAVTEAMGALSSPHKAMEILLAVEDRVSPPYRANWYDDLAQLATRAEQHARAGHYFEKAVEAASASGNNEFYFRLRYAERLCEHSRPDEALQQAERCVFPDWNPHAVIHHKLVCGAAVGLLGSRAESTVLLSDARHRLQQTPFPGLADFSQRLYTLLPATA